LRRDEREREREREREGEKEGKGERLKAKRGGTMQVGQSVFGGRERKREKEGLISQ